MSLFLSNSEQQFRTRLTSRFNISLANGHAEILSKIIWIWNSFVTNFKPAHHFHQSRCILYYVNVQTFALMSENKNQEFLTFTRHKNYSSAINFTKISNNANHFWKSKSMGFSSFGGLKGTLLAIENSCKITSCYRTFLLTVTPASQNNEKNNNNNNNSE